MNESSICEIIGDSPKQRKNANDQALIAYENVVGSYVIEAMAELPSEN